MHLKDSLYRATYPLNVVFLPPTGAEIAGEQILPPSPPGRVIIRPSPDSVLEDSVKKKQVHFESNLNRDKRTATVIAKHTTVSSHVAHTLHCTMHANVYLDSKLRNDGPKPE